MRKSTIFQLCIAICLVASGKPKFALSVLKELFQEVAKQDFPWRPMTEHPEANSPVDIIYYTDATEPHSYNGFWDGVNWLMRKPYTMNEYDPIPENFELIGWKLPERAPYKK